MLIYKNGEWQDFSIYAKAAGMPLGHIYPALYDELSSVQLRLDGQELKRTLYQALWAYVLKHPSILKTEEEWQQIAAQDGGVCRFFSSGDGSTTFRLPKYPSSEVLEGKPDYVIQAFGFVDQDANLSMETIENMINDSVQENTVNAEYVNSQIETASTELKNDAAEKYLPVEGTAVKATADASGNNIEETYVKNTQIGNEANKLVQYSTNGHIVLPTGIEIY